MDTTLIVQSLRDLQSVDQTTREKAEKTLTLLQKQELFAGALINILVSSSDDGTKLPAAIVLKESFNIGDKALKEGIVKAVEVNYLNSSIW